MNTLYQQLFLTSSVVAKLSYKVSNFQARTIYWSTATQDASGGNEVVTSNGVERRVLETSIFQCLSALGKHHLITIVYRRSGLSDRTTRCGIIPLKCIIGLEPSFQQRLTRIPTLYRVYTFQNLRPRNVHGKVQESGRKKETAPTVTRSHSHIRRIRGESWTYSIVRERPKQTSRVSSYLHQGLNHQL